MFVGSLQTQYLTIFFSFINYRVARDTKHVIDSLLACFTPLGYKNKRYCGCIGATPCFNLSASSMIEYYNIFLLDNHSICSESVQFSCDFWRCDILQVTFLKFLENLPYHFPRGCRGMFLIKFTIKSVCSERLIKYFDSV